MHTFSPTGSILNGSQGWAKQKPNAGFSLSVAGAQVIGISFIAFPGILTGSYMASGKPKTRSGAHMRFQHCNHYLLCHNNDP